MVHNMNLQPEPFARIRDGKKTIELRLLDEKRQTIQPGDFIVFNNQADPSRRLRCRVMALHIFKSFRELYANLPLEQCGYLPEEVADADPKDMEQYYSAERQAACGVVGIELEVMAYTDLVFDLYGTLVDIHTEENDLVWEKTAFFFGFYNAHYTPAELKHAFRTELTRREAKAGQSYECFPDIPFEQIMEQLFREKGVENAQLLGFQAAQLFRISSLEYIRLYPYVLRALQTLREEGCQLWLLSNAQRVFTAYELRLVGLEPYFDGIYISSDYGCRKPDLRFYQALLQEQGLHPESCLMIGNDRETDIAGAKNAGMDTLYMHTELTPGAQAAANPAMLPGMAEDPCHHYEFEGDDWEKLVRVLSNMKKRHR